MCVPITRASNRVRKEVCDEGVPKTMPIAAAPYPRQIIAKFYYFGLARMIAKMPEPPTGSLNKVPM